MHMNTGGLKSTLKLAIGLHYDCTVNLDVEDGLTNGATCTLQKIEYRSETKISAILWVLFLDPIVGKIWRQRYRSFYQEYKQILDTDICITRTLTVCRSLVSLLGNNSQFAFHLPELSINVKGKLYPMPL